MILFNLDLDLDNPLSNVLEKHISKRYNSLMRNLRKHNLTQIYSRNLANRLRPDIAPHAEFFCPTCLFTIYILLLMLFYLKQLIQRTTISPFGKFCLKQLNIYKIWRSKSSIKTLMHTKLVHHIGSYTKTGKTYIRDQTRWLLQEILDPDKHIKLIYLEHMHLSSLLPLFAIIWQR